MKPVPLSPRALNIFKKGGVFVPSPLALDANKNMSESYQRLLTLYYIQSGAKAVIPGAHTGEFAGGNLDLLDRWLLLVKEMVWQYGGDNVILMAAVGGPQVYRQAELAARHKYDIVMIAPTAFAGKDADGIAALFQDIASIIPTFGFELQRAIPGSYTFTKELWLKIFDTAYGAKGASFDTYLSIIMLEAAAESERREELTLLTGNDDRIVTDLSGIFPFLVNHQKVSVTYSGGLLGHFSADTHAAADWAGNILKHRENKTWSLGMPEKELAHAVNRCNMALFDALGNFENSVWGVKYRLTKLGLLPNPYCFHETGRQGQAEAIDTIYGLYPSLCDEQYLAEHLRGMKLEVGIPD